MEPEKRAEVDCLGIQREARRKRGGGRSGADKMGNQVGCNGYLVPTFLEDNRGI